MSHSVEVYAVRRVKYGISFDKFRILHLLEIGGYKMEIKNCMLKVKLLGHKIVLYNIGELSHKCGRSVNCQFRELLVFTIYAKIKLNDCTQLGGLRKERSWSLWLDPISV